MKEISCSQQISKKKSLPSKLEKLRILELFFYFFFLVGQYLYSIGAICCGASYFYFGSKFAILRKNWLEEQRIEREQLEKIRTKILHEVEKKT